MVKVHAPAVCSPRMVDSPRIVYSPRIPGVDFGVGIVDDSVRHGSMSHRDHMGVSIAVGLIQSGSKAIDSGRSLRMTH